MKTIRLRNFRSLTDTKSLPIAPISILLGQNSSGKSTLIRSLPLLKQGLGVRAQGPFLWLGQLVDFGSFEETLSSYAQDQSLSIEFEFETIFNQPYHNRVRNQKQENVKLSISELRIQGHKEICFEYVVTIDKDVILFQISADKIISFSINGSDYARFIKDRLDVKQWVGAIPSFGPIISGDQTTPNTAPSFTKEIINLIRPLCHGKTENERISDLSRILIGSTTNQLLSTAKLTSYGDTQWKKHTKYWTEETLQYVYLRDLVIGANFFLTIGMVSEYLTGFLYNSRYIKPLRASAERYYRKQGLAVDEIDPEDENFALFLHNMDVIEKASFKDWSEKYFGIWIDVRESTGHLSLVLNSTDETSQNFNMADAGFGYSQMFPILAQLWAIRRPRNQRSKNRKISIPFVFSIEQPELHLHPRLQAKLADVFVSAISAARDLNIDIRLIIETHSEYLVNRLGYLISKKELSHLDVSITIFEKEKINTSTSIRQSTFSEKGHLQNWPFGFFEPEIGE